MFFEVFLYRNKEKIFFSQFLFVCAHYDEEKNRIEIKEPFMYTTLTFVWVSSEYSMLEKKMNPACTGHEENFIDCAVHEKEEKKKICNFFVYIKKFPSVERKINWPNCKFPLIIVVVMVMGIIHATLHTTPDESCIELKEIKFY
jgi:hypothetical protein